jgi:hypothetical protein
MDRPVKARAGRSSGGDMTREPYKTRSVLLRGEIQRATMISIINNLPCDDDKPIEVVVREQVKARGLDANARMWVGPLKDIAAQAYVQGRTYSAEVWHEQFKAEYLPDETAMSREELATLVKNPDTYLKYDYTPKGTRVLVGSTTDLTRRGFALHMQQIILFGESIGVQFSASPRERYAE